MDKKFVFVMGLVLAAVVLFYPPWYIEKTPKEKGGLMTMEYAPLITMPLGAGFPQDTYYPTSIDFGRLLVELLCIGCTTGIGILLLPDKKAGNDKK